MKIFVKYQVEKMIENRNGINTVPEPFKIQVHQEILDDLNRRLETTIWTDEVTDQHHDTGSPKP